MKRVLMKTAALAASAMLLGCSLPAQVCAESVPDAPCSGLFGDVNQDGRIDVHDADTFYHACADIRIGLREPFSDELFALVDVDGDGRLTYRDMNYILMYYANTRIGIECSWRSLTGNPNAPSQSNLK